MKKTKYGFPTYLPKGLTYNRKTNIIKGTILDKQDWNKQITPHFKWKEFRCKSRSSNIKLDWHLPNKLEELRKNLGNKPITITSGYRTPKHNQYLINKGKTKAKKSQHLFGRGSDIWVKGTSASELKRLAQPLFTGIGTYKGRSFIHVDVRPKPPGAKPTIWHWKGISGKK